MEIINKELKLPRLTIGSGRYTLKIPIGYYYRRSLMGFIKSRVEKLKLTELETVHRFRIKRHDGNFKLCNKETVENRPALLS